MMNKKFPPLDYFGWYFGGFWMDRYIWEDTKPNYQDVIEFSLTELRTFEVLEVIEEIKRLLSEVNDDDELGQILGSHGLNLHAPGINLTYRQWLESVLEILENGIKDDDPPSGESKD